jgi:hypothetical protein
VKLLHNAVNKTLKTLLHNAFYPQVAQSNYLSSRLVNQASSFFTVAPLGCRYAGLQDLGERKKEKKRKKTTKAWPAWVKGAQSSTMAKALGLCYLELQTRSLLGSQSHRDLFSK